ncbi:MAG: hypothetical protein WDM78_04005 [Puia sp.]
MRAVGGIGCSTGKQSIRLFVIDSTQIFTNLEDDEQGKYPDAPGLKKYL